MLPAYCYGGMKMLVFRKVDENGLYVEDVLKDDAVEVQEDERLIMEPIPDGLQLWHPKWNGTEWIEGKAQDEIDEMQNQPHIPSTDERVEFLEQDYAMVLYDSMIKDDRIDELETMNAEMLYMIMTGGM